MTKNNIVLIGFMASGKSRIGAMLKDRLGYELYDIDAMIEHQQEAKIKDIFASHGETFFRQLESNMIQSLQNKTSAIIVTGAGALVSYANARALMELGQVFFLDAQPGLILQRLQKSSKRPLGAANSEEEKQALMELYRFRIPIYKNLGITIDVNHEDKEKTCDDIMSQLRALQKLDPIQKIFINDQQQKYTIFHGDDIVNNIADIIIQCGLKEYKPIIITNESLKDILKDTISAIQSSLSYVSDVLTIPEGEAHKNWASLSHLLQEMSQRGLTRKTVVLALGGGIVGDVAGFAASLYMRGLPFIQIPTTLLAMVDASIGGKTGIDTHFGKNLLGAFHNPSAVIIHQNFLKTLPKDDMACGIAEIIKHAIIADKELFYRLKDHDMDLGETIKRSLLVKAGIIFCDPKEHNIRAHLNLGHTFAHAIEKVSNYEIKHGYAVAMGLVLATKLSQVLGILEEDFLRDLEQILKKYHLPTRVPAHIKFNDLTEAMKLDKKNDNNSIRFILPKKVGEVVIHPITKDLIPGEILL